MSKQFKIGLLTVIVLIMVLLVWLFSSGGEEVMENGKPKPKPFVSSNWSRHYQLTDKDPYGLYLFASLTDAHLEKQNEFKVIVDYDELDTLIDQNEGEQTYMFVGNYFGLDNHEMDAILEDVESGSTLFMSFDDLMENIYPRLFESYEFKLEYDDQINVFADDKKYPMINLFQNDTVARDWWAFGDISFEEDHESLSDFMEMSNFVRVKYGDGELLLHSTPNLFYNYQLKRSSGYQYSAYVLDQIPENQDVCFLELGRLSDNRGTQDTSIDEGGSGKEDNSYLKEIFGNKGLLTALFVTLLAVFLFVIFRSKRMRPVVPFIPEKKDMTMAFAETITSIYFAKRNPYGLLQVQRKNFYDTVHRFFFVDLNKREDDRPIERLAEKSNISKEELTDLINSFETKKAASVSEQFIADVARRQHKFYKNSGILSSSIEQRISATDMTFRRNLWLPAILVVGGIAMIFGGVYMLVLAKGIGIALWPLGIFTLLLGVLRLSRPYLIVTDDQITYYSPWAVKKEFKREELIRAEMHKRGVILIFSGDKQLIINYWDLSVFDREQFERFVSKFHNREL